VVLRRLSAGSSAGRRGPSLLYGGGKWARGTWEGTRSVFLRFGFELSGWGKRPRKVCGSGKRFGTRLSFGAGTLPNTGEFEPKTGKAWVKPADTVSGRGKKSPSPARPQKNRKSFARGIQDDWDRLRHVALLGTLKEGKRQSHDYTFPLKVQTTMALAETGLSGAGKEDQVDF